MSAFKGCLAHVYRGLGSYIMHRLHDHTEHSDDACTALGPRSANAWGD